MKSFRNQFSTGFIDEGDNEPNITPSQSSLIVAILSLGTVVGSLFSAPAADFCGRRKALVLAIVVFSLGVTLQIISSDIPMLLAGRYVINIGLVIADCLSTFPTLTS
jgi:MFS transporter, SP family, sugar:H+ symporter